MFNSEKLKINVAAMGNGMYSLAVTSPDGRFLDTTHIRRLLFSWDEVSFCGTKVAIDTWNGQPVFLLDSWGLLNFFAQESFNSFVDWEFSEAASLCLAAAPILHESVEMGVPLPNFESLEHSEPAWALPLKVEEEFIPSFWDEPIVPDLRSDVVGASGNGKLEAGGLSATDSDRMESREDAGDAGAFGTADALEVETNRSFIERWYNSAANTYLKQYSPVSDKWSEALSALMGARLTASELQAYFDKDSWAEWLGLTTDTKPFTIGLRLTEPPLGVGPWKLDVILRSKKDENLVETYSTKRLAHGWSKYRDSIEEVLSRWLKVAPWLGEAGRFRQELSEFEAWEFLTDASEKLMFLGAEILLPSWWMALKESSLKVKAKVKSQANRGPAYVGLKALMDFDWRFSLNGEDLSEAEFAKLVNEKRRLVYIRGQWVKLDPAFIKQIQDLMETASEKGLPLSDLLQQELLHGENDSTEIDDDEPDDMLRIQFELNQELRKMVGHLREAKSIPQLDAPAALHGELRPYQRLGMSWLLFLREHGFGACLADDMGLGKTVQMIAYLLWVKEHNEADELVAAQALDGAYKLVTAQAQGDAGELVCIQAQEGGAGEWVAAQEQGDADKLGAVQAQGDETWTTAETQNDAQAISAALSSANPSIQTAVKTTLIVCPTSVLGNWQRELEKFAPSLKVYLHYGSQRPKGEDFAAEIAEYDVVLTSYGLTHQDFDELVSVYWGTIILDEAQNIKNAQTKQSRAVRKLRGQHHVALTGTPMENRLSELWAIFDFINKGYLGTLGQFQEKYVATIERDEQKDKIKELQRIIQPFLLRRTKRDQDVALNLPDKQEQKEFVPLTTEQASLYEQLLQDTFANIEQLSAFERKGMILQMLNKLKQLCNHPALYLKEDLEKLTSLKSRTRSGKLDKLTELVDAVREQEESCLIFTQYIGMGNMMKKLLEHRYGIEIPFLNGSANKKQRDDMITKFQDGEFPIFILSLKAGGTGLNLTAANHVIHYDRWWNPAVENQATDRAYRIGQKRFVHVHKLICTGTLEEKIDQMLDKKQALNDEIISSDNWITELSTEEIKELVALH